MQEIKYMFEDKYASREFVQSHSSAMIELIGANFLVTRDSLFGEPNKKYIEAEISWYESESLNVNDLADIYGKRVAIWDSVADENGFINSNYGWAIYSSENGYQFNNVVDKLVKDPDTRQASMIYTRPSMHTDAIKNGMHDFMCTNAVNYYLRDGLLHATVQMRSNDIVYGFNNDVAWQKHVLNRLVNKLKYDKEIDVEAGNIYWNASSLHMYERHFKYLDGYHSRWLP